MNKLHRDVFDHIPRNAIQNIALDKEMVQNGDDGNEKQKEKRKEERKKALRHFM